MYVTMYVREHNGKNDMTEFVINAVYERMAYCYHLFVTSDGLYYCCFSPDVYITFDVKDASSFATKAWERISTPDISLMKPFSELRKWMGGERIDARYMDDIE